MEDDDWIFLGDGGAGGSDTDSASDAGSDSDSGFTIVRRGRKGGGDGCSVVVSDDAPAPAVAATPPGSFKVVSYAEAFSASSEDCGGDREQPGCSNEATDAGEAIVQGTGIVDAAAGTGSTDDCTAVKCKEGCDSGRVGEHDGTGSYVEEEPSVAVAAAPTVNCPETTAVLHGDAHSELASRMDVDQGGAEEVEDEDSESESCEEDDDNENSSGGGGGDDDTDSSSEEDTDSSSEDEDEDTFSSGDEEDEDTFSSGDEEDEDTFSSGDEDYTEIFSEEEYTAEIYSEEEEEDDDDDDAESFGEEDDLESSGEMDYVEIHSEEENDDSVVSGEDQEEEDDDAECSDEVDDVESTGEEEDAESAGEEEADDDMDTDSSGSGSDMDTDSSDMEDDDCLKSDEQADIVDIAQNGNQDIFAMLFPKAKACGGGANMDDYEDESENGYVDYEAKEEEDGYMLLPRDHAIDDDIDTDSSGMEDNCLESDENGNQDFFAMLRAMAANIDDFEDESEHCTINYENEEELEDGGNQDFFAMLRAMAANIDDYDEDKSEHGSIIEEEELEDGSWFDMLFPRDSSDEEDEAATATATACGHSAEPSHRTRRQEFAARGYDDVDTDSDMEVDDDEVVAADVDGTSLESQHWGFACQSQTERQALSEDLRRRVLLVLRRQLAAEAFEPSSGQQRWRSYDDVDDTCDVPGTAAPGGGPAPAGCCACTLTAEAQFTARDAERERALAMEEAGRREAAQRELDRALARQAAPAAQALESALQGCPTAKRQATGVTRSAVAERDVPVDITFIIGLYLLVYLVVSLLPLLFP